MTVRKTPETKERVYSEGKPPTIARPNDGMRLRAKKSPLEMTDAELDEVMGDEWEH